MKIKVRNGMFETNSSSMHSICILNNVKQEEKDYNYDTFYIEGEGYNRYPFNILFDEHNKLSYCLSAFHCGKWNKNSDKFQNEIINYYLPMIQRYHPNIKKLHISADIDFEYKYYTESNPDITYSSEDEKVEYDEDKGYYLKETGEELIEAKDSPTEYLFINPNESDSGFLEGFFKKMNITEEEFIFNPKYFIVVDGDEYCIFHDMMDKGIITNVKAEYCEYHDNDFGI